MVQLAYINTNLDLVNSPVHIGNSRINKKEKYYLDFKDCINFATNRKDDTDTHYLYRCNKNKKATMFLSEFTYLFTPKHCDYHDRYRTDGVHHSIIITDKKQINNLISKLFLHNEFMLSNVFTPREKNGPIKNLELKITFFKNACVIQDSAIKLEINTGQNVTKSIVSQLGINSILKLKSYYITNECFLYSEEPYKKVKIYATTNKLGVRSLLHFMGEIPYLDINNQVKIHYYFTKQKRITDLYKDSDVSKRPLPNKSCSKSVKFTGNIASIWNCILYINKNTSEIGFNNTDED